MALPEALLWKYEVGSLWLPMGFPSTGSPICCRAVWVCGHTPAVKVHAYADYLPVNLTEASLLGDGTLQRKCLHQIGLSQVYGIFLINEMIYVGGAAPRQAVLQYTRAD